LRAVSSAFLRSLASTPVGTAVFFVVALVAIVKSSVYLPDGIIIHHFARFVNTLFPKTEKYFYSTPDRVLTYKFIFPTTSKNRNKKTAQAGGFLFVLLKDELLVKQYPNQIDPRKGHTKDGNDQANDQTKRVGLLQPSAPSDCKLSHPVDKGDEQQKKLYQTALFVKPSHFYVPPNRMYFHYSIFAEFAHPFFTIFTHCSHFKIPEIKDKISKKALRTCARV
jgi:hypothetical protein